MRRHPRHPADTERKHSITHAMQHDKSKKRPRVEGQPEPPAAPPRDSTPVLKQQRAAAARRLREMVGGARAHAAEAEALRQSVDRLRGEAKEAKDALAAVLASGDNRAFVGAAKRATELQEESDTCAQQLERLVADRKAGALREMARVVQQRGVVADQARYLLLQVRAAGVGGGGAEHTPRAG